MANQAKEHFGKLYGQMTPEERKEFNKRNKGYRKRYRQSYDRRPERIERRRVYYHQRTLIGRYVTEHSEEVGSK